MIRRTLSLAAAAALAAGTALTGPATASAAWPAPGKPAAGMRSTTAAAISWKPVWGAPKYLVKYSRSKSWTSPSYLTASEPRAELTGLKPGTRYYVKVRVQKTTGASLSGYGATATFATRGSGSSYTVLAPGGLQLIARNAGSLTIDWRPRGGAATYQVKYATNARLSGAAYASTRNTSLRLGGLKRNTTYWIKIRTKSSRGTTTSTFGAALKAKTTTGSVSVPIRAATYNILCANCATGYPWAHRRAAVVKAIKAQRLDVLGAQEASQGATIGADGKKKAQFADLVAMLGSDYKVTNKYRYNCVKSTTRTRCKYRNRGASHDVRIIYHTGRIALLRQGSLKFAAQMPGTKERYAAWAELRQRSSGKRFFVINTHLDPGDDAAGATLRHDLRRDQTRELIALIRKRNTARLPVVILGDFKTSKHAMPNNAPYDVITRAGYLDPLGNTHKSTVPARSAIVERRIGTEYNTKNNLAATAPKSAYINGSVIDYVYVSPRIRVSEWETVVDVDAAGRFTRKPPSDHNMVRVSVYLP